MDLQRQLTRRHEDESARAARLAPAPPREEALDHRQPERGRLAGARLGAREQVGAASGRSGNGLGLDRRGLLVAEARQR